MLTYEILLPSTSSIMTFCPTRRSWRASNTILGSSCSSPLVSMYLRILLTLTCLRFTFFSLEGRLNILVSEGQPFVLCYSQAVIVLFENLWFRLGMCYTIRNKCYICSIGIPFPFAASVFQLKHSWPKIDDVGPCHNGNVVCEIQLEMLSVQSVKLPVSRVVWAYVCVHLQGKVPAHA